MMRPGCRTSSYCIKRSLHYINPAETWSIALYSEFDTLDDVKFYAAHPDHVAAGKLIAEVKESRACVDYEV